MRIRLKLSVLLSLGLVLFFAGSALAAVNYPLSMSPGGDRVVDASGRKVFFQGDAPWHMMIRLTREEVIQYLDDREAKGFNALLFSIVVGDGYYGSSANRYGEQPFLASGDFTRPNEAYFEHADWVLEQANQRGIIAFLTPTYIGYECNAEGWCDDMKAAGVSVMRDFGRWIGNRYLDQPNIVWVEAGDANPAQWGVAEEVDAVAEGILDVDSVHLHTAHCARYTSGVDCCPKNWLDINTTYADCQQAARKLLTDYQRSSTQPFVFIEGRYEDERDWSAVCMRSQAYWTLLLGGQGHFFGSYKLWDFPSDGSWVSTMNAVGSRSMDLFHKLLRSRHYDRLIPDTDHVVMTSGYGSVDGTDYAAAARTTDGQTVIAYMPSQRAVVLDLTQVSGEAVLAWWYDPDDGTSVEIGRFPTTGARTFTPPSSGDWVLVVDDESSNLAAPGSEEIQVPTRRGTFGGTLKIHLRQSPK